MTTCDGPPHTECPHTYTCGFCGRDTCPDLAPSPDEPDKCADCVLTDAIHAAIDGEHDDATWDDLCWWQRSSGWRTA